MLKSFNKISLRSNFKKSIIFYSLSTILKNNYSSLTKIIINASDIAAAIGKNPFKQPDEIIDNLWLKYQKETITFDTHEQTLDKAINADISGQAIKILNESIKLAEKATSSSEASVTFDKASVHIKENENLSIEQKKHAVELLKSKVFTTFGTKNEDKAADELEVELKLLLGNDIELQRQNQVFYHNIYKSTNYQYVIAGRIDRLAYNPNDESIILIEIKNRIKRLFEEVKDYEYIQVQSYLKMLNLNQAKLVERYNNNNFSHDILFDKEFFNDVIMYDLINFTKKLDNILTNQQARDEYALSRQKFL